MEFGDLWFNHLLVSVPIYYSQVTFSLISPIPNIGIPQKMLNKQVSDEWMGQFEVSDNFSIKQKN